MRNFYRFLQGLIRFIDGEICNILQKFNEICNFGNMVSRVHHLGVSSAENLAAVGNSVTEDQELFFVVHIVWAFLIVSIVHFCLA